jgi:mono/diheme cytochrome c family protein
MRLFVIAKKSITPVILGLIAALTISACDEAGPEPRGRNDTTRSDQVPLGTAPVEKSGGNAASEAILSRWYAREHLARGEKIYAEHCAACHGPNAEGTTNWRQRGPDGKFPPPPLNGTAHTWHHPVSVLLQQIRFGAPGGIGNMPGFEGRISGDDMAAVIAWIQSKWPDEVYTSWVDINEQAQKSRQ